MISFLTTLTAELEAQGVSVVEGRRAFDGGWLMELSYEGWLFDDLLLFGESDTDGALRLARMIGCAFKERSWLRCQ